MQTISTRRTLGGLGGGGVEGLLPAISVLYVYDHNLKLFCLVFVCKLKCSTCKVSFASQKDWKVKLERARFLKVQ